MSPRGRLPRLLSRIYSARPVFRPVGGFIWAIRNARPLVYGNPLYPLFLVGRAPQNIIFTPPDPWPGNAERGNAILAGEFPFFGETAHGDESLWSPRGLSPAWSEGLHGFSWINDLHVIGSDAARRRARILVGDWIGEHRFWSPLAWRSDVTGDRIAAWLGQYDFFCASAEEDFRGEVFKSLARQARHLARTAGWETRGARRLRAIRGLIYAGICLPNGRRWLARGLRLLSREIDRQILPDGSHFERCPRLQLSILKLFIDIRACLAGAKVEVPPTLQSAIDRMAPMLRFFRHGDGGLALFNDSMEGESWLADMVLTRAEAKGKPLSSAPHGGFQRLNLNRCLVIMDSGAASLLPGFEAPPEEHLHAGALGFEMSIGKERMIVNCGAQATAGTPWQKALKSTAAHSTLTIEDTNSTEILANGRLGRRRAVATVHREEENGNILIESSHNGYEEIFGVIHQRRLFLASGGEDFRGEDTLFPSGSGAQMQENISYALRFHLHPTVSASLLHNRQAALLRLPSGGGWRLRVQGGELAISESVYLGRGGEVKRCEQVVVTGTIKGGMSGEIAVIIWAFNRV